MENELNINELVELKQMPVIFYQLETIGKEIDKQLAGIDKMECTEDNKQEVKKRRAEINNLNKLMEDKRKELKKRILADYEVFNEKYEEEIKSKLTYASGVLSDKINEIESEQKHKKQEELISFAEEYIKFYKLEGFIEPNYVIPTITLSASEKSLKAQIKYSIEKIATEIDLIKCEEEQEELLAIYKTNFDFVLTKCIYEERKKARQEAKETVNNWNTNTDIIEPVPIVEEKKEEMLEVNFTVWGYKDDITKIRNFIRELGVKYE